MRSSLGRLAEDSSLPVVLTYGPGEERLAHDVLEQAGDKKRRDLPH